MIKLEKARESDKELYRNMFNMYHNFLSLYVQDLDAVDEEGYFDKNAIDDYFTVDENILPYVVRSDGKIAGVMVITKPPYVKKGCDYFIQETFFLELYKGQGVALAAFEEFFKNNKGRYGLVVLKKNLRAINFWNKVAKLHGGVVEKKDYNNDLIFYEFVVK